MWRQPALASNWQGRPVADRRALSWLPLAVTACAALLILGGAYAAFAWSLSNRADPVYGEKGCIFIVTRPGMPAPNVQELGAFLTGGGLAKYKCPERVEVLDEFPLTRVGKLNKPALKTLIADMLAAESTAGAA